MYGKDSLKYLYSKDKGTTVQESDDPRCLYQYDHDAWEANYDAYIAAIDKDDSPKIAKSLKPHLDKVCCLHDEMSSTLDPTSHSIPPANPVSNGSSQSVDCPKVLPVVEPSSASSHYVIDLASTESTTASTHPTWLTTLASLTRKQLGTTDVPKVTATPICSSDIRRVFGAYSEKDPLTLNERPPEQVVSDAGKALRMKQNDLKPTDVQMGNLGTFSNDGIAILKKFCEISSLRASIRSEDRWLMVTTHGLSANEVRSIEQVLWHQRIGETILKAGQKSVDVGSFSTLVGERYLDNFVIDVAILHYLGDGQKEVGTKALYLPCETHTWLNTNDELFIKQKFRGLLGTSRENEFDLILLPLHMNETHWGLIVIDLLGRRLLFDDGFKLQPASSVLPTIKYILDVFQQLMLSAPCFNNSFWSSINALEQFGMPSQHNCGLTGQGTGSCGVGVILAARDFIFKGVNGTVNQFVWQYTEMRHLRKKLMIQIIKWASE